MSKEMIRKSLELTKDQWRKLDELAALLQSIAKGGPGHNKSSWRILIRQIADSQLTIKETEK